ncbi:MAG: outer membrane beta-barrel protein, partial [Flavitalea sp.]
IGPSVNFQSLYIDNKFLKNDPIKQDFFYVLPSLNIQWNGFGFNYSARAQEPQVNDLQPVVDNTNPLYIQLGNPSLVPAIMQQLSLNFFKHDQKHSITYNAYMMGSISDNTVIRERTVDAQGVQTTRPVNVNGIWQFNGSGGVRKQIKLINSWNMALAANFFGNYSKSVILINRVRSAANNWTLNPSGTLSFNYKDLFEINETYRLTWTKSVYDNAEFPGLEFMRHNSNTDLVVRLPKHWVWETSVDYFYNPQVAPGIRKSNFRWNAGVNFLFLKNDQAQLKFHVFDLLNQNVQVQRTVRENYIQDFQTSVLQRYFMLTFTYNIRNLNAGKVGGRQSMFMF